MLFCCSKNEPLSDKQQFIQTTNVYSSLHIVKIVQAFYEQKAVA